MITIEFDGVVKNVNLDIYTMPTIKINTNINVTIAI